MDALQARFRDKASELLQAHPTLVVALGRGPTFAVETCYFVGTSDELYCIVKPNPALVEAVREDPRVAFAVNQGFPKQTLQGAGRAFFLGGLDRHPQIREQVLAKIPDAAAFITTIRNLGVLQILPERLAITDDSNLGLGPRPVYQPEAALALPTRFHRWLQALHLPSWPLSLIPALTGALLTRQTPVDGVGWLALPLIAAVLLFHTGALLLASYVEVRRRGERAILGPSRVLLAGLLPAWQLFWAGLLCLMGGALIGLFLVGWRGAPVLWLGLVAVLSSLLFAGWPVFIALRAVADGLAFLCLGPLLASGVVFVLTGGYHHLAPLISLPLGLLAEAIVLAGHLRTLPDDARIRVRTTAVLLGWQRSRWLYTGLIGLAYALLALLVAGVAPGWTWLAFLSLPLAARSLLTLWRAADERADALTTLRRQTAQLHLAYGTLLVLGLTLG
jgi:1,4-dihydroxy-2-naphthoate octaprenyltransferase